MGRSASWLKTDARVLRSTIVIVVVVDVVVVARSGETNLARIAPPVARSFVRSFVRSFGRSSTTRLRSRTTKDELDGSFLTPIAEERVAVRARARVVVVFARSRDRSIERTNDGTIERRG
jgi:hypothetical protein